MEGYEGNDQKAEGRQYPEGVEQAQVVHAASTAARAQCQGDSVPLGQKELQGSDECHRQSAKAVRSVGVLILYSTQLMRMASAEESISICVMFTGPLALRCTAKGIAVLMDILGHVCVW